MEGLRLPSLYAWQDEALTAWRKAGKRGIVEAVTGTGKTLVGTVAIVEALRVGRRAAVLVPTRELQTQWRSSLRRALPGRFRIGQLGGGCSDDLGRSHVVIAIVNSAREARLAPPYDALLVADECHRYASEVNRLALQDRYKERLGLTATLERPDRMEREILPYFGSICYEMRYERAIADEVTAHFNVALVGVGMSGGERAVYDELSRKIRDHFEELTEHHGLPSRPFHRFIAEVRALASSESWSPGRQSARAFQTAVFERKTLLAVSPSKQAVVPQLAEAMRAATGTLVFTDSIGTAEAAAESLENEGLRAGTIHSGVDPKLRKSLLVDFGNRHLDVVVAPRVLDEGVDVPGADLAVVVAASKSRRQMIQRMGRILRRKSDDRLARLVILYLRGTTEDPELGAHEAFLREVTAVAERVTIFDSEDEMDELLAYLQRDGAGRHVDPPRYAGDPPRAVAAPTVLDEDEPGLTFLGIDRLTPEPLTAAGPDSYRYEPAPCCGECGSYYSGHFRTCSNCGAPRPDARPARPVRPPEQPVGNGPAVGAEWTARGYTGTVLSIQGAKVRLQVGDSIVSV
jgi:RNA polymerase primary sigma factor